MSRIVLAQLVREQVENAFPFTIDKLPLCSPEGLRTPHYGLFRSDSGESVGVAVKRGYEPHTVDDVSALAEAAGASFEGSEPVVRCCWRDGVHHVSVAPSDEYRQSIFGSADNVFPRLIIRAGYDGRAFRASLGLYRDACRNLMMLRSDGQRIDANIRHTHHLRSEIQYLETTFSRLAAGWEGVVETARALDAKSVDLADFLRRVYPLPEAASRRTQGSHERRVSAIVHRIMRERQITGRGGLAGVWDSVTAWEAVNGVQGYVQHDQLRRGRPSATERAILALDDSAVSRATELALAM